MIESDWVIVQIRDIPEKWAEVSVPVRASGFEAGEASERTEALYEYQ